MSLKLLNVIEFPSPDSLRRKETGVLLTSPRYIQEPAHGLVYCLRDGRVGSMPVDRYKLPFCEEGDLVVVPGYPNHAGIAFLSELAAVADRIAPWVTVHVVPRLLILDSDTKDGAFGYYDIDGDRFEHIGGISYNKEDFVILTLGSPDWMIQCLAHELMHNISHHHLNKRALETLRKTADQGILWPSEYLNRHSECYSRMMESYALGCMLGSHRYSPRPDIRNPLWILDEVWSGRTADQQIIAGLVPDADRHLLRRGLKREMPPSPKKPTRLDRLLSRVAIWIAGGIDKMWVWAA
jgi:hypothetical protein